MGCGGNDDVHVDANSVLPFAFWFWVWCFFNAKRFNFYISTNAEQVAVLGDDGTLRDAFPFFPPMGVLAAPLFGKLNLNFYHFISGFLVFLFILRICFSIPSFE